MGIRTKSINKFSPLRGASFIQHCLFPANDSDQIMAATVQSAMTVGTPLPLSGASNTLTAAGEPKRRMSFHWAYCPGIFRSVASGGATFRIQGLDQFGEWTSEDVVVPAGGPAVVACQPRTAFCHIESITPVALSGASTTSYTIGFSTDAFDIPAGAWPTGFDGGDGIGAGTMSNQIALGVPIDLTGVISEDQDKFALVVREQVVRFQSTPPAFFIEDVKKTFAMPASLGLHTGFTGTALPATIVHLQEGWNHQ